MFTSPYLIVAGILTVLGIALFIYGKKAPSVCLGVAGIALMGEPCFIFDATILSVVAVGTVAATACVKCFTPLN